jgi:NADH dehydrogenase FAD-containing subunit
MLRNMRQVGKKLVLVGGGHAHLKTLLHLQDFIQKGSDVTLISPFPYHYYSAMGPGMLSGMYKPEETRFNVQKMAEDRGATFIKDRVEKVNAKDRTLLLQNGRSVSYDIVSFNTGSGVAFNGFDKTEENIFTVKPIINLLRAREYILASRSGMRIRVLVVGGGPAGVEIAVNVWKLIRDEQLSADICIMTQSPLFNNYPQRAQELVRRSLERKNIEIMEHAELKSLERGNAVIDDGIVRQYDVAFLATGIRPSPIFSQSGLPVGKDGGLSVNRNLRSEAYPEIFGAGDCIYFKDRPLPKVGVYAIRESDILYHNLLASMRGAMFRPFKPQRSYMLIFNMGDGSGILVKNGFVWHGRTAFALKNYIDRKMMKKYQVSGEADE